MLPPLKVILVDDEPLARQLLSLILTDYPGLQVVGEAGGIQEARHLLQQHQPDVVFLDVEMHHETGFELLDYLDSATRVVFVTAFGGYAVRAFDVNALDYVMKPVSRQRLDQAIQKLLKGNSVQREPLLQLEYDDRLLLKINNRSEFLKINTIKCIFAEGNYSKVWTATNQGALTNLSLKEWEDRLPEKQFIRVHRSAIINFEYVDRVEGWFNFSFQVYVTGVTDPVTVSRRFATQLRKRMK
ncbi:MAG: LytTR family DNA-binding domain-containing protein [Blastocatellia bacterium]|nr:LytTR family DNA-binding domain-containing protein [Blastocatellia bacterium]